MKTQLQKWGNSLAIRIPRDALNRGRFRQGDYLELEILRPGSMKVRRTKKKRVTLTQLVRGMTRKARHKEVDWGPAQGREVW